MSRWLEQLRVGLRSIVYRRRAERELDDEMRYHLDLEIEAQRRAGLPPDEARYAALRAMGAIEKNKDDCGDLRRGRLVREFLSDLRYAGRTLRRRPGFATLAIVIMAIGIGANTAVFSVVNGVLLKSLPYPGADRIVVVRTAALTTGQINPLVTLANFWDWPGQSSSFEAMATYRGGEAPVTPGDTAEFARHANVDVQLFRVFGVEPVIGRTFGPEDLIPEISQPVAVISHAYWQSRYGGDRAILQRTIRVGSLQRQIVGVIPPDFQFPSRTDVWTPQTTRTASRTSHSYLAVARLKAGVSLEAAEAELNIIAARLAQQYPDSNKGRGVSVARLQDQLVGDVRLMLYLMWGAVGVGCLAVAGVYGVVAHAVEQRSKEIALRIALGASRTAVLKMMLGRGMMLATVGGVLGLAGAVGATRLLETMLFEVKPLDVPVYLGVAGLLGVVTLLASYVPARRAAGLNPVDVLKTD